MEMINSFNDFICCDNELLTTYNRKDHIIDVLIIFLSKDIYKRSKSSSIFTTN